jgi:hypothetical protein
MNSMTNLVASCARPRALLAACYSLALLSLIGCGARSSLLSSQLAGGDYGGEGDATGGFQAAGGRYAASVGGHFGVGGAGGSGMTGGYHSSGGSPGVTGGSVMTTGGYHSSGGSPGVAGGAVMASGGMRFFGGSPSAGGVTFSTGGRISSGGTPLAKGGAGAGGTIAFGGSTHAGGSPATGGTVAVGTPAVQPDGYVTLHTGTVVMQGHVSSYESGSGSSITLTYTSSSFCASGTVPADSTYSSWAGAGFNVNQAESGASGTSGSLALTGSSISVTYVNRDASPLELQLYDGSNYWCTYLPASASSTTSTIPFSQLNTQCWDGLGSAFVSGTPITTVQLMVACSAFTPTPFDFCFQGMTVQ